MPENLKKNYPQGLFISAAKNKGVEKLKEMIYDIIFKDMVEVIVKVPFNRMQVKGYLHETYEVLETSYLENEAVYRLRVKKQEIILLEKKGLKVEEVKNRRVV